MNEEKITAQCSNQHRKQFNLNPTPLPGHFQRFTVNQSLCFYFFPNDCHTILSRSFYCFYNCVS